MKIWHDALVMTQLVEDELIFESIIGDIQKLHTLHLSPGITGHRVKVHILNRQFLNFVEPSEAPVKSQDIRIADIPNRNRDL